MGLKWSRTPCEKTTGNSSGENTPPRVLLQDGIIGRAHRRDPIVPQQAHVAGVSVHREYTNSLEDITLLALIGANNYLPITYLTTV